MHNNHEWPHAWGQQTRTTELLAVGSFEIPIGIMKTPVAPLIHRTSIVCPFFAPFPQQIRLQSFSSYKIFKGYILALLIQSTDLAASVLKNRASRQLGSDGTYDSENAGCNQYCVTQGLDYVGGSCNANGVCVSN